MALAENLIFPLNGVDSSDGQQVTDWSVCMEILQPAILYWFKPLLVPKCTFARKNYLLASLLFLLLVRE
jgi:hypothetical protein